MWRWLLCWCSGEDDVVVTRAHSHVVVVVWGGEFFDCDRLRLRPDTNAILIPKIPVGELSNWCDAAVTLGNGKTKNQTETDSDFILAVSTSQFVVGRRRCDGTHRNTSTMATSTATTTTQTGPTSQTPWTLTTSTPFEILGKECHSTDAIRSYHSPRTNLRGLVVKTDEPICSLHILLATESTGGGGDATTTAANSKWHQPDDGLPHTLEHLIFLGSRTHPHKGILDKLANRCMADGTNAWTATDHTAYTLSTAGSEGVVNLMPIFADHVLFPTLTGEGFVTEVHHLNGRGEDKGVVYCEMQVS